VYGDFSRVRFIPLEAGREDPYSGVLVEQGRLLVDADLNEQAQIAREQLRRLTADMIGPSGGFGERAGFEVSGHAEHGAGEAHTLTVGTGVYYVQGLRCEAHKQHSLTVAAEGHWLVTLTAWEESVSALTDRDLPDPAFAGAAGSRRTKVEWVLSATNRLPGGGRLGGDEDPGELRSAFAKPRAHPKMRAQVRASERVPAAADAAPVASGYSGQENRLYRVEIHRGGTGADATFKWSRCNGSAELAVMREVGDGGGERKLELARGALEAGEGLIEGDWVELLDETWQPLGSPAPLLRVVAVEPRAHTVTLVGFGEGDAVAADRHPFLRRWDRDPDTDDPARAPDSALPVAAVHGPSAWHHLEHGIFVQFDDPHAAFVRGDHWLIPARTARAQIMWPADGGAPRALPPAGPARYVAPLARLHVARRAHRPEDLRCLFELAPVAPRKPHRRPGGDEHEPSDRERHHAGDGDGS
jgi:hypothetical protein